MASWSRTTFPMSVSSWLTCQWPPPERDIAGIVSHRQKVTTRPASAMPGKTQRQGLFARLRAEARIIASMPAPAARPNAMPKDHQADADQTLTRVDSYVSTPPIDCAQPLRNHGRNEAASKATVAAPTTYGDQ